MNEGLYKSLSNNNTFFSLSFFRLYYVYLVKLFFRYHERGLYTVLGTASFRMSSITDC